MRWGILIGIITLVASIIITIILNLMGFPIFFFAFFLPLIGFPLIVKKGDFFEETPPLLRSDELNYCPNCGYKISGWENYCPNCGFKLK